MHLREGVPPWWPFCTAWTTSRLGSVWRAGCRLEPGGSRGARRSAEIGRGGPSRCAWGKNMSVSLSAGQSLWWAGGGGGVAGKARSLCGPSTQPGLGSFETMVCVVRGLPSRARWELWRRQEISCDRRASGSGGQGKHVRVTARFVPEAVFGTVSGTTLCKSQSILVTRNAFSAALFTLRAAWPVECRGLPPRLPGFCVS